MKKEYEELIGISILIIVCLINFFTRTVLFKL